MRRDASMKKAPPQEHDSLLIFGDNVEAMRALLQLPKYAGRVRLVYIDPPYGTRQAFLVSGNRSATISRSNGGRLAYSDILTGDSYLTFLEQRLKLIRDLMADDGTIYVHIDSKMGHYVKCLMDRVFGQRNFLNDITRIKCNPKNFARRAYGNVKDMVLFYSKAKHFVWNEPRKEIDIPDDNARFNKIDAKGRRYTTTPLHAPGETVNGETGQAWRDILPPAGRHWRYSPKELERLDQNGLIEWSSTGNPRKIIYAEEVMRSGVKMQDVWFFKDPQTTRYPTEKNAEMLKMIVQASSNLGDLVLDAFCGSGTTLVAAQELGRRWVGIDSSPEAIATCKKRLFDYEYIHLSEEPKAKHA